MNNHTFCGRLGRDAELKSVTSSQGATSVCNFSVAVDDGYGERKTTIWISCALWGKRADALNQYLKKGQQVVISGASNVRAYAGNDGSPRAEMTCRVAELDLVGQRNETSGSAPATPAEFPGPPSGEPAGIPPDVPF